jgi:hypothetical protein
LAIVAAIGGGALLTVLPAASQEVRTITLDFADSEPVYLDVGGRGYSKGDVLLFQGVLTDEQGQNVGRILAEATLFDRQMSNTQIFATISLADGDMAFQGRYNFAAEDQGVLALTGGTGAYTGTEGTLHGTIEASGNVNLDITLQP